MKEKGTIYVVGLGPGNRAGMTHEAHDALEIAEVITGYKTYVDLVIDYTEGKEVYIQGMGGEIERCQKTIEFALEGKNVALVCSGDSGVYGMASLVMELAKPYPDLEIKPIAGVSAANSGAARLGAPLSHDYAVISLSDYLTPLSLIEKRLRACSDADMCLAIYNPRSKPRHDYLEKAVEIILEYKSKDTICGYVQQIGREGENFGHMTLEELKTFEADMLTTVFVGNKDTKIINGRMVTPRGYEIE